MSSDSSHRIPKDQAQVFQTWALPDIDSATGRIISSEEKRQQDAQAKQPKLNETIEVVEELVKLPTAQELEAITQQAQQEGYQLGLEEGMAKGLADGLAQGRTEGLAKIQAELEPELEQQIELLQQLSLQLSQAFTDQESVLQPLILQMVENLSRQFIGRALEQSSTMLLPLIEQAVKVLPAGAEQLVIEYNSPKPEELEQALNLGDVGWRLQENLELSLGSCKISSKYSSVEIDMEQRLEQLFQQFCAGSLGGQENYTAMAMDVDVNTPSSGNRGSEVSQASAASAVGENFESAEVGAVDDLGLGPAVEKIQPSGSSSSSAFDDDSDQNPENIIDD